MKRVLFFGDPRLYSNRQMMLGIASEPRVAGQWFLRIRQPGRDPRQVAAMLKEMKPDAVFIHSLLPTATVTGLLRKRLPCVVLGVDYYPELPVPAFVPDEEAIGRLAAEHLLDRGFTHYAFVGYKWATNLQGRLKGYSERLQRSGRTCTTFMSGVAHQSVLEAHGSFRPPPDFIRWLRNLPRPCALLAGTDSIASTVLEACLLHKIQVPHELAVLGVDDDSVLCHTAWPPLSSVRQDFRAIGREAAGMICDWNAGNPPGRVLRRFVPIDIVLRDSTDMRHLTDPLVAKALVFITRNIERQFQIRELVRELGVSSQTLTTHFHEAMGRTPLMEVRRQRVDHARRLLEESDAPIAQIAKRCGFGSAIRFCSVFKEFTTVTPTEYRRKHEAVR